MKITWHFTNADLEAVRLVVTEHSSHPIVQDRLNRNLANHKPIVTRERFWKALCMALLTTQQPSGPGSAVTRLLAGQPFKLSYAACAAAQSVEAFVTKTLIRFGGIRRHGVVGAQLQDNLSELESRLWQPTLSQAEALRVLVDKNTEIIAADFLNEKFVGLGPKQARNLLQALGLTRYEVPIDSRVTKWLRKLQFPAPTSAAALADRDCYRFVLDGYQQLCAAADLFPCVVDGAVFASFDKEAWNTSLIQF